MTERRRLAHHETVRRARELRKNMTGPERRLWLALRDRRLAGWKFRRQAVIGPFIVDFYSHAARLVVEIDGASHHDRADADRARQAWIEAQGLNVIRISNDDVLRDLDSVVEGIATLLTARITHEQS